LFSVLCHICLVWLVAGKRARGKRERERKKGIKYDRFTGTAYTSSYRPKIDHHRLPAAGKK
jgi:hypothetical protein